jgi:hypothetical protein
MAKVAKIRTCGECKRKFANPDSFRKHKHSFGGCKSEEGLIANEFIKTENGWKKNAAGNP